MKHWQLTQSRFCKQSRWKRRCIVAVLSILFVATVVMGRPFLHLAKTVWSDAEERELLPKGFADDASRMNMTEVLEIWPVPNDDQAAVTQLAQLFQRAEKERLRISIAGARHSMGGHCLIPGGIVIDMTPFKKMELDEERNLSPGNRTVESNCVLPLLSRNDGCRDQSNV